MNDILNVEIKTRVPSIDKIRDILLTHNAKSFGVDHQIDTYFEVPKGRLKVRQGNVENSLIYYERSDKAEARESDILLEKLDKSSNIKSILNKVLEPKIVIDKKREIFFIDNVKFHIDDVEGLGRFIEIEAISENSQYSKDYLEEQVKKYSEILKLKKKDILNLSYSDLNNESFSDRIYREAALFESCFKNEMPSFVEPLISKIDHLCYRTESEEVYNQCKSNFQILGKTLISSIVGGREITTYKLSEPILFCGVKVDVIELASPKPNNKYATGFEHLEIVIADRFESFMKEHSAYEFDTSAMNKNHNPEIRISLSSGLSIKFHHSSLESVIEYEKSMT
jgi:adenylate cyclase class 2